MAHVPWVFNCMLLLYRRGLIYPSGNRRNLVSGHKSKRQNMDLNYVRTQVKIEKDGFDLCPDTSKN